MSKGLKPGQCNNREGAPKKSQSVAALFGMIEAEEMDGKDGKVSKKEILCRKIMKQAYDGDMKAVEFIADRTEGKVTTKLEIIDRTITFEIEDEESLVDRAPDADIVQPPEEPKLPPEAMADNE